jgi:hypothetical protein
MTKESNNVSRIIAAFEYTDNQQICKGNRMVDKLLSSAVTDIEKAPKVNIKGKEYATVATRVEIFRKHFGTEYGIVTEAYDTPDMNVVRVKACITNPTGHIIASGLAQEDMTHSKINFTSSLEVAETSAIGRALANLGLLGGEYASFNEMDEAIRTEAPEKPREKAPDKLPSDKAQASRPSVNQYKFHLPKSAADDQIDLVFGQIDAAPDVETLTAYYNELAPLLSHMPEDVEAEIMSSFRGRKAQILKGM